MMIFHQLPLMALSETLSTWGPVAVVILGLVGFAVVLRRLARLEAALQAQDPSRALDMIGAALTKAAEERGDLDHRRLEHVLNEVRGGIKRTESSVMAVIENQASQSVQVAVEPRPRQVSLRERMTNRLLALGYSDIRFVTPAEEMQALADEAGDGAVTIEARQGATQVKGRVQIRSGAIGDMDLRPFYSMFP
jgi:hypothetical protein